jgi:hypothetical protein
VDRDILIEKLEKCYGFKDTVLNWFVSYLSDRTQMTKYGIHLSSVSETRYGVPQGSVLGPLLFILFINDVVERVGKSTLHLFADDMLLYCESESVDEGIEEMNKDLDRICEWINGNRLKLNVSKSKGMVIKPIIRGNVSDTLIHKKLMINDTLIDTVNEIKYLGVIIDNSLSFKKNLDYVCNKISKKLGYLSRVGKCMSTWTRKLIYMTIVEPHFLYCNTIFYNLKQYDIMRLQKLNNRAMRIILKERRSTSVTDMRKRLDFVSIKNKIELSVAVFIHKIMLGLAPEYLKNKINIVDSVHNHNTRNRKNIFIQSVKLNSILTKGFSEYNKLAAIIRNTESILKFKKEMLKKFKSEMSSEFVSG